MIQKLFWLATIVGSTLGGLTLLTVLDTAESAPQQAAGAAMACAYAILPYCMSRAIQGMGHDVD